MPAQFSSDPIPARPLETTWRVHRMSYQPLVPRALPRRLGCMIFKNGARSLVFLAKPRRPYLRQQTSLARSEGLEAHALAARVRGKNPQQ